MTHHANDLRILADALSHDGWDQEDVDILNWAANRLERDEAVHTKSKSLTKDIAEVVNKHSRENESDTPDFLLAGFLVKCLVAYELMLVERAVWHGGDESLKDLHRPSKGDGDDASETDAGA